MKTLKDIEFFDGVKIMVRVDFNVPIKNGVVVDDFRIRSAFPTIDYLLGRGAKVILIAHLEPNDGESNSLKPVADCMDKLGKKVVFVQNWRNARDTIENNVGKGECVLLENLRVNEGEKVNDSNFAKELASLADIYVNDAFSVSHRKHASIVGISQHLPSYAGLQLENEVSNLSRAFDPKHPFLFILGGAKFETKLPLVEKFLNIADSVFVGGALANDILKEKGYEVGISLVSKEKLDLSKIINNPKLLLPFDIITQDGVVKPVNNLSKEDNSMDCGSMTVELLKNKIAEAKFILWNGPLGIYEKGYKDSTLKLARLIAEASEKGSETIVGGGDTLASIAENRDGEKFTFISTAGGAMLDFLANGTLPGIEALK